MGCIPVEKLLVMYTPLLPIRYPYRLWRVFSDPPEISVISNAISWLSQLRIKKITSNVQMIE